jgi:hypothetical protein
MVMNRRAPDETSMDRCPASQFVHYFDSETRGLACRFVDAHIGWAVHVEQVDCPACREILARGATAASGAALVAEHGRTAVVEGGRERRRDSLLGGAYTPARP